MSILKRSTAYWNLVLFLLHKLPKESSLSYYLPITVGVGNRRIHAFPKGIIFIIIYVEYLFTHPSTTSKIWHKVNFYIDHGWSELFYLTVCLTKAKEPSLPHYLPIIGDRKVHTFHKGINTK